MPDGLVARALDLFDRYVEMPANERSRALSQLRETDPDLHAALQTLLDADAKPALLDTSLVDALDRGNEDFPGDGDGDPRIGTLLGPWLIEAVLGHGGMGTVYRASRADGHYQRQVALKCMRTELSSPALIAAFLNERSNLAHFDHPSIAMLLDGGIEDNGHPWFAMRHVEGEPIDSWCDGHRAGIAQRVELLAQVCEAMAYAHGKGVLHQDIKPSNLLITPEGQLQIVDFGLSSLLADTSEAQRLAVSYGYAAPEAVRGEKPSVAMDIHSIGVVMYQLLCGAWPRPAGALQMLAVPAAPVSPKRLARRAADSVFRTRGFANAQGLAKALEGDLGAIALKCVADSPSRRYANAHEIAADLRRHLAHRPLAIRRGEPGYVLRRFFRRNRIAAALVVGLLVAGASTYGWQTYRTRQEIAATDAVSRLFESTLGTATLAGLGETRLSSLDLIGRSERDLRRLRLESQPRVLARAYGILARNYALAGDYGRARRLAEEASALSAGGDAQRAENAATLASLLNAEAKYADARTAAEQGLNLLGDAQGKQDQSLRLRLLNELALAQWKLTERGTALATLDRGIALARKAEDSEATAALLTMRGYWESKLYRRGQAEKDLQEAVALSADGDSVTGSEARIALIRTLINMDRMKEAMAMAKSLVESRQRILGNGHPETGRAWLALAQTQFFAGEAEQGRESVARSRKILAASLGTGNPEYIDALTLETTYLWFGDERDTAIAQAREALQLARTNLGESHDTTIRSTLNLANKLMGVSSASADYRASVRETEALYGKLIAIGKAERLPQPLPTLYLAELLLNRNEGDDLQRAKALLDDYATESTPYFGPYDTIPLHMKYVRAKLLYRLRDYAESDRLFTDLLATAANAPQAPVGALLVDGSLRYLAFSALHAGRKSLAKTYLTRRVAADTKAFGERHEYTLQAKRDLEELARTGSVEGR